MAAVTLPVSLQHDVRRLISGGLRFVPDREAARDHGAGYACYETVLFSGALVRVAASVDPDDPTVVEFCVPGGPWGTEVEMCGGVFGATVDGKLIGEIAGDASIDGIPLRDVIEGLRSAAIAAGRHSFELGAAMAVLDRAA